MLGGREMSKSKMTTKTRQLISYLIVKDRMLSLKIGVKVSVSNLTTPIQHHRGSPRQGNRARKEI